MAFVPKYILILFFLITLDYVLGILLEKEENSRKRKLYLIFSIVSNIGLLFVFKYFNFFNENLTLLAHAIGWNYSLSNLSLLLPLGLSFHTFQSLSYIIEVYRKKQKAERHFGIYALFVLFFPQLVAGPIERAHHMIHQFYEKHAFELSNILEGLKIIILGFFLKIVIADRASLIVDAFYKNPQNFTGPETAIALILFAFQLYGDFAGYTLIATGSAKMLGFELTINFRRPYFAKNISEFWQRWHISLSSWFRDYVYQPIILSRKRVSATSIYLSIIITFLLSGVWHGAGWTFVFMGIFYGFSIVIGSLTKKLREKILTGLGLSKFPKIHSLIKILITFGLVCIGWVFFRSPNLHTSFEILRGLTLGWQNFPKDFADFILFKKNYYFDYRSTEIILTFVFIIGLLLYEWFEEKSIKVKNIVNNSLYLKTLTYAILLFCIIVFGQFDEKVFIYFQF